MRATIQKMEDPMVMKEETAKACLAVINSVPDKNVDNMHGFIDKTLEKLGYKMFPIYDESNKIKKFSMRMI